ncbi:MAG: MFS transporter [Xanthobacteraceae bacterium]|uniref:MFS transporter n=1 Tax=Pseudolabrys sp. TaxID=1960880 RepID=UPI003D0B607B
MTSTAAPLRPGFITRLALLYAAIFTLGGVQLPFFPVWLAAKGLDERAIGLVLALPMVVRVAAVPLATRIADRGDAVKAVLAAAAVATVAGYVLLGFAEGALAIGVAFALASFLYTPIMPLTETYALRGLAARGRAYGPVRLWGSLAFIAGTFAAGAAIDLIPHERLIWLLVGASLLIALTAVALEPMSFASAPAAHAQPPPPRRGLLRDKVFLLVAAAAALAQASHAVYYGFSALAWTQAGLDGAAVAALWALGVIAEIALFACQERLPRALTPLRLLALGAAGAALRWLAMAFDPPVATLPVLQLMHGLSFGAVHLGSLAFVARHAPPGQGATAQGYFAIALGLAMAGATGLAGVLFASFGNAAYAAMALAAVVGCACACIAKRLAAEPAA